MRERDLSREACPARIAEDLGGAFAMGCIGGSLWNMVRGYRLSPATEKMRGAFYHMRARGPILGGNFAVWGGTFSSFDCAFEGIRGTSDTWNSIASGFCTGGVLAMRGGWRVASQNAVLGGVLLSIIELVSAVITRHASETPRQQFNKLKAEGLLEQPAPARPAM